MKLEHNMAHAGWDVSIVINRSGRLRFYEANILVFGMRFLHLERCCLLAVPIADKSFCFLPRFLLVHVPVECERASSSMHSSVGCGGET